MMRVLCAMLLLVLLALSVAWTLTSKDDSSKSETKDGKPTVAVLAVAKGNNEFAFDLYRQLAKDAKEDENILFSPTSISSALAMMYAGMAGEPVAQMAKVLRFDKDQSKFHPTFAAFVRRLSEQGSQGKSQLLAANRIWVAEKFPVGADFQKLVGKHYGAGLQRANFVERHEEVRQEINSWVSDQTQKRR
jgi:serpin B